jgi:ATP-dependent protease HslVU (ClpYQ) peptidase subunit
MTVIIGYIDKENDTVYMGGDSAITFGNTIDYSKDKKVFQKNDFLIGTSGLQRTIQILKYDFYPPDKPENMTVEQFINTLFINSLRECFKNNGFAEKKNEKEEFDSTILVGYKRRLFRIAYDYSVHETERSFISIGCGEDFAEGALSALMESNLNIEERIKKALEIAGEFCNGVESPYYVLKM